MSEPSTNTANRTGENPRRYNSVDIHESIESLIPFTDSIKAKIHEFRTEFKKTYQQYLNLIGNPQSQTGNHSTPGGRGETNIQPGNRSMTLPKSRNESGRKVQYPLFHKVAKIYDSTMKLLSDFMTTFTEDSRDLYSKAIQISSLKQEFDNILKRNYDRRDYLEANELYQINNKIENIIENHNKLVIDYNAGIEHFNVLRQNLSNGVLVYESSTGKDFVLSRDDDLDEFRRLVEIDEVLQKRRPIYASFASRFKSDLQYSADSTVLMSVRPLKKDNWILQSLEEHNNDASGPFNQEYQPPGPFNQEYQSSGRNSEFDDTTSHHVDPSVPHVERGNGQRISGEPMVISPPMPNTQSNYKIPSPMIHQRQRYEAASSKPEDEPLKRVPNLNPNIVKDFQHPRKETTINYVVDRSRHDSQQPRPQIQNRNKPGPSNQVHLQSQPRTESEKSKGDGIDNSVPNVGRGIIVQETYRQPMVGSPPTPKKTPSSMIPQRQRYEEAAPSKLEDEPSKRVPNLNPNIVKDFQHPRKETTINYVVDKSRHDSQQPRPRTQNRNKPGPSNQEHQQSQPRTESEKSKGDGIDNSVPNVERGINVQETYQEPMVASPPAPKSQSNYETPSPMIRQRQRSEEAASSKPENEPQKRVPNSEPNIEKNFRHPRKKTTTITYVADKNRDGSQRPDPNTQNNNKPEASNQVHLQSQPSTESETAKGDDIDKSAVAVKPSIDVQQTHQQPMESQRSEELQSSQPVQHQGKRKRQYIKKEKPLTKAKRRNINTKWESPKDLILTARGFISNSELDEILDSILTRDLSEVREEYLKQPGTPETGLSPIKIRNSPAYTDILDIFIEYILFQNDLIMPEVRTNLLKLLSKLEERRSKVSSGPHDSNTQLYVNNLDKVISRLRDITIDPSIGRNYMTESIP